jgi:hypothetical protein
MKEMILLLCGILIGRQLMAQTFSEWFRQNHTQLKYLAEQIAALKGYDGILQQGYAIGQEGLDSIWSIRDDDLDLHTDHFTALDSPSSAIKEEAVVATIEQYCTLLPILAEEIEGACRGLPSSPLNWPNMGPNIATNLRQTAATCDKWLDNLLTSDRYRMDDAGRLNLLNDMSRELRSLYGKASLLLVELDSSTINPWL